jgi:ubiquinone biosynthesis protein
MSIHAIYGKIIRYKQIVEVLSHHQFGYIVDMLGLSRFITSKLTKKKTLPGETDVASMWVRTRMVLEDLGGTYIKMGQMLSTRADILPAEMAAELEKLQDQVPHFPFEDVKKTIEKELGTPIDDLFQKFDPVPFASASIGQVHSAVLTKGDSVVVKVQRPEVQSSVSVDCEILLDAAKFLERRKIFKGYHFVPVAQEIKEFLEGETDYLREAHNAERFRKSFSDDPSVYVPAIHWGHTTGRVLTMEKVEGTKIIELERLQSQGFDLRDIARKGINAYMKQILSHGFFHADPHPGNLFVTFDGKIAFVDFGLVGEIDPDLRAKLGDLFIAIVRKNLDGITDALTAIGSLPPQADRLRLKKELGVILDQYSEMTLKEIRVGEVIREVMNLIYSYQVRIPSDFTLMIKTFATLEGLGKQLDPEFNIFEVAEPYARELVRERMMSRWWITDTYRSIQASIAEMRTLVRQLTEAFRVVERGDLRIVHEHQGLQKMVNRLSSSILAAALIIGSSWLLSSKSSTYLFGIIGFAGSALLALWLLYSILRSGRM